MTGAAITQITALRDSINPELLSTEEATKHALLLPVLHALGWQIFNPAQVVPEYNADVTGKRGEKVDYAIMQDGVPILLIEAKAAHVELRTNHLAQLARYFAVTDAKIGVLSNGLEWQFYAALEKDNIMDARPYYVWRLDSTPLDTHILDYSAEVYDPVELEQRAARLSHTTALHAQLHLAQARASDEVVRALIRPVHSGKLTRQVVDQWRGVVQHALSTWRPKHTELSTTPDSPVPAQEHQFSAKEHAILAEVQSILQDLCMPWQLGLAPTSMNAVAIQQYDDDPDTDDRGRILLRVRTAPAQLGFEIRFYKAAVYGSKWLQLTDLPDLQQYRNTIREQYTIQAA